MDSEKIFHPLKPVFDENSKILILGTMPSPKSRELGFYYSHPQNRFWPVLEILFDEKIPKKPDARKEFALQKGIALWDVLKECDISGASDSSIKNAVPNDLSEILKTADIKAIFTTGATAAKLYHRLIEPKTKIPAKALPSTSPANAKMSLSDLSEEYKIITEYLK